MQAPQPPSVEIAEQLGQELLDELVKPQLEIDAAKTLDLVARGAKLDMVVNTGFSALNALMMAMVKHQDALGLAILARMPDDQIDARSSSKFTALLFAAANGTTASALELLRRGADPHAVNGTLSGALVLAAEAGHYKIVVALLDKCVDPDLPGRPFDVSTPLMGAASYGRTDIARELILRGADTTRKDERGLTARKRALENNRHDTVAAMDAALAEYRLRITAEAFEFCAAVEAGADGFETPVQLL